MRALLAALGANTCVSCTTAGADCLDDRLCGACARALPTSPSALPAPEACTEAWAWGDYAGAVGELVRVAKYRPDEGLARVLVGAASLRSGTPVGYDAIVPVPAGRWRTWRRGFSLPSLLAERLADAGSTPVRRCLERGDASAQAGVSRSARRSHAAGVWSVRGPARGPRAWRPPDPEWDTRPYTLRLSRRIPAQPGYSREGEGGPYPEDISRIPRGRLSAPRHLGVLETARGAGSFWVPCGLP